LRHTFATQLCARNVPLRTVQELMGHSTVTVTERYAHVAESMKRSAVNALSGELVSFGPYMGNEEKREPVHVRPLFSGQDVIVAKSTEKADCL